MSQRKIHKRHIRNVQRSKGTYYVTIPIELARELKLRERQKVEVRKFGKDRIIISDWKK